MIASNLAMGSPNARRSLAYLDAASMAFFDPPTLEAPNLNLPILRTLNAMVAPLPTSYKRFSAGTFAF